MSGIYIHIPFCKQKCTYCDFHFSTNLGGQSQMTDAICSEIAARKDYLNKPPTTIYFGGGSPSILTSERLGQIFKSLHQHFDLTQVKEVTLETNPDDHKPEHLKFWKSLGINRLSIGIQSFHDRDLYFMNRAHDSAEAKNCVELARQAGFNSLTIDLIYGIPGQSFEEWKQNIETAIALDTDHISAYCLTIESRTVLAKQLEKGAFDEKSDEEIEQEYLLLHDLLEAAGFEHYEISNFAKPGKEALHNSNYWTGKPYLGIGPSAHSFDGAYTRSWNISNNTTYIKGVNAGETMSESEKLDKIQRINEQIMTGLRTKSGLNYAGWEKPHQRALEASIKKLPKGIRIRNQNSVVQLDPKNWLLADDVIRRLMF